MAVHPKFYFKKNYSIRSFEADHKHHLSIAAMVNLMQNAAMRNVQNMGVSAIDLQEKNLSWVLTRKRLTVHRLPHFNEKISVATHPSGTEKFFTYRDFIITDEQGKNIAEASSTWLLMDTNLRKMVRIPQFILDYIIPFDEDFLQRPTGKLLSFEENNMEELFSVQWHQLDFNEHLNNVYYMQWMLDTVDEHTLRHCQLKNIDIQYRHECHWKDKITCQTKFSGNHKFLHRLIRERDNKEIALAKSEWTARQNQDI